MSTVVRLLTFVEIDKRASAAATSVSARHEAELDDGRRVLLLDDRGWSTSGSWATMSVEEMHEMARMVVGPDEPREGFSRAAEETGHWGYLQQILQQQGIVVDAAELKQLPHDVVLSQQVRAHLNNR